MYFVFEYIVLYVQLLPRDASLCCSRCGAECRLVLPKAVLLKR